MNRSDSSLSDNSIHESGDHGWLPERFLYAVAVSAYTYVYVCVRLYASDTHEGRIHMLP